MRSYRYICLRVTEVALSLLFVSGGGSGENNNPSALNFSPPGEGWKGLNDCMLMSTKKHDRPVWRVRVRRTNLPGQKDAMVYVPRVVLRGTLDVKGLAAWASRRSRGHFDPALLELAAAYLMGAARDALVAGYAVDVPLGRLTPSVTGAWNPDRGNPAVRAQNQATASFAPGPL